MHKDTLRNLTGLVQLYYMKNTTHQMNMLIHFQLIIFSAKLNIHGIIFEGKRSGEVHNFTTIVSPVHKNIEKFRGGIPWFMIDTKHFTSKINFRREKRKVLN